MRWAVFFAKWLLPGLVWTGLQAQTIHQITLSDGSNLGLDESMFYNLRVETHPNLGRVVWGGFRDHQGSFIFLPTVRGGKDVPTTLALLFKLTDLQMHRIEDSTATKGRDIYRIDSPPGFEGWLITHRESVHFGRRSRFLLAAPELDFYAVLPEFLETVVRFQPSAFREPDEESPNLWWIIGGIGLFVAMVVLIWFVFRRVAVADDSAEL